jgi:hypothetical protein
VEQKKADLKINGKRGEGSQIKYHKIQGLGQVLMSVCAGVDVAVDVESCGEY